MMDELNIKAHISVVKWKLFPQIWSRAKEVCGITESLKMRSFPIPTGFKRKRKVWEKVEPEVGLNFEKCHSPTGSGGSTTIIQ